MRHVSYGILSTLMVVLGLSCAFPAQAAVKRTSPKNRGYEAVDTSQAQKRSVAVQALSDVVEIHNLFSQIPAIKEQELKFKDALLMHELDKRRLSDDIQCNVDLLRSDFKDPEKVWNKLAGQAWALDRETGYELSNSGATTQADEAVADSYEFSTAGVANQVKSTDTNESNYKVSDSMDDLNSDGNNDSTLRWEIGRKLLVNLYAYPESYGKFRETSEYTLWNDQKFLYDQLVWEPKMEKLRTYYLTGLSTDVPEEGGLSVYEAIQSQMQKLENQLFRERHSNMAHESGKIQKNYLGYMTTLSGLTRKAPPADPELRTAPQSPKAATTGVAFSGTNSTESAAYYLPLPNFNEIFYIQMPEGVADNGTYPLKYANKSEWESFGASEYPAPWKLLNNGKEISSLEKATYAANKLPPRSEFYQEVGMSVSSKYANGIEPYNRISTYLSLKEEECNSYDLRQSQKQSYMDLKNAFLEKAGSYGIQIAEDTLFTEKEEEIRTQIKEKKKEFLTKAMDKLSELTDETIQKGYNLNQVLYQLQADEDGDMVLTLKPKENFLRDLKQMRASNRLMKTIDDNKTDKLKEKMEEYLSADCISAGRLKSRNFNKNAFWPERKLEDGESVTYCVE
jgi:hypothetical protein